MFFVGGLFAYLLYSASRSNMIACDHCGLVFRAPSPPTDWRPLLALLGVVAVVFVVIVLVGLLT